MRAQILLLSSCVLFGAVTMAAQAPPQAPGAAAPAAPAGPKNLKVLPKTWTSQQVGALMNTFAESLGERCIFCHAENPDAPPPAAGQQPRLDYTLDTKKEKDVAREMIKMVMTINDTTKAVGDAAVAEKVSCFTCHQGQKKPAVAPANGWSRGSFTLSQQGPATPQRGGAAGAPGGAGAPPAGGAGAPPAGRGN
ncbi:MAG: c-type cytochrome [Vicinamibacterales bacterium]